MTRSRRRRREGSGGAVARAVEVAATLARHGLGLAHGTRGLPIEAKMRVAAETLGPSFVKLGQLVASSPGLFPEKWSIEMGRLRADVAPFAFADVLRTVEADLARPIVSVFSDFEETPIKAASIGQVHRATLRSGEQVVVKVQRPGLPELVRKDVKTLLALASLLQRLPWTRIASPRATAEDFARTLHEEIDFRMEADSMDRMRRHVAESGIEDVVIPEIHWEHTGPRVLTMQRVDGIAFDDIEAMQAAGIDTPRLLRMGVQSVVEGVLVYGFFHGDLHAGNMAVLPDGRFVLYDFGIVGRLTESVRQRLATYLIASVTLDHEALVRSLKSFGSVPDDVDIPAMAKELERLYEPFMKGGINTVELGTLMMTMIETMVRYQVHIPRELVLLSKQLLYLEGAARTLAPDADLLEEQQIIYNSLMSKYPQLAMEFFGMMSEQAAS